MNCPKQTNLSLCLFNQLLYNSIYQLFIYHKSIKKEKNVKKNLSIGHVSTFPRSMLLFIINMSSKKIIALFDVDGTLSESRKVIISFAIDTLGCSSRDY